MIAEAAERALAGATGPALAAARWVRQVARTRVDESFSVFVVVWRDGATGMASAWSVDREELAGLGKAAEAAVSAGGTHPGPVETAPARAHDGWDPAVARLEPGEFAGLALAERWAWRSTAGLAAEDATSAVQLTVGTERAVASSLAGIDVEALKARDRERQAPSEQARFDPAGRPLVLSPRALGQVLFALAPDLWADGPLADRLGQRVAAAAVNLADSPRFVGTAQRARDAEGTPKAPPRLIQDGVMNRLVSDRRRAGDDSTGHARLPDASSIPLPMNLVLAGGGVTDEDELIASAEGGIYAGRARVVPKHSLLILDHTRRIEDGRLGARDHKVELRASPLDVLAAVQALTARPRLVGIYYNAVVAPAVRLAPLPLAAS